MCKTWQFCGNPQGTLLASPVSNRRPTSTVVEFLNPIEPKWFQRSKRKRRSNGLPQYYPELFELLVIYYPQLKSSPLWFEEFPRCPSDQVMQLCFFPGRCALCQVFNCTINLTKNKRMGIATVSHVLSGDDASLLNKVEQILRQRAVPVIWMCQRRKMQQHRTRNGLGMNDHPKVNILANSEGSMVNVSCNSIMQYTIWWQKLSAWYFWFKE